MMRGWWAMVAVCATAGCGDLAAPAVVNTGAMLSAAQDLSTTFTGNPAYQSLGILSTDFPLPVARSRAFIAQAPRETTALFPSDLLGATLGWDSAQGKYVVKSGVGGAPATGVRFLLYAADPQAAAPVFPLQQLGSVDLVDQSTPQANQLGVVLKLGATTVAQYTITDVTATASRHVTLAGWLTAADGSGRVDFTLDHLTDFTDTTLDRHYTLSGGNGAQLDLVLHVTPGGSGTSRFHTALGRAWIDFHDEFTTVGDSGTVSFDGVTVAKLSGESDVQMPTFVPLSGRTLSAQQQQDLAYLFVEGGQVGSLVSGLFGPALAVFGGI